MEHDANDCGTLERLELRGRSWRRFKNGDTVREKSVARKKGQSKETVYCWEKLFAGKRLKTERKEQSIDKKSEKDRRGVRVTRVEEN